jgi:dihydroaeruginoic acid synthetase
MLLQTGRGRPAGRARGPSPRRRAAAVDRARQAGAPVQRDRVAHRVDAGRVEQGLEPRRQLAPLTAAHAAAQPHKAARREHVHQRRQHRGRQARGAQLRRGRREGAGRGPGVERRGWAREGWRAGRRAPAGASSPQSKRSAAPPGRAPAASPAPCPPPASAARRAPCRSAAAAAARRARPARRLGARRGARRRRPPGPPGAALWPSPRGRAARAAV